jgi:hypothetical protein
VPMVHTCNPNYLGSDLRNVAQVVECLLCKNEKNEKTDSWYSGEARTESPQLGPVKNVLEF